MKGGHFLGFLALALFFCSGCLVHLCGDGRTIATDLSECPKVEAPKIDSGYEECARASTLTSGYEYQSPRDVCFYNLALDRSNVSLCKKILNSDPYGDYSPARCGASIALLTGDPGKCELLGMAYEYDCYSELAGEADDPSHCDRIALQLKKESCLADYVYYRGDSIKNWSICDRLSSGSYEADDCYYKAAMKKRDTAYCDKIANSDTYYGDTKASCYGVLASDTKNASLCERLTITLEKDECYYGYATSYPYNISYCDKITDEYLRSDCIYYSTDYDAYYENYTY